MNRIYKRLWLLTLFISITASALGQQRNILAVPDTKVSIGQAQLPITIENTDEIVGLQFDITLPTAVTAENDAVVTNRCDGHTIIIRKMEATRYRVMLYSEEMRPLIAQQGTVFYIPIITPQSYSQGGEHPMAISNATMTVASGENVLTEAKAGKLIVSDLPDLTVKSIQPASPPTTIVPNERLSLSWQVQNVGGATTGKGWSEQILLVNKLGTRTKLLATTYCEEILAAGGMLIRQAEITVPQLLGIEGEAYLQVRIVPTKDTGESTAAQGNNTLQASETFNVSKRLFVEVSPSEISENSGQQVMVKVSRSGDWSGEQVFSLTSSDTRFRLPQQVTIPASQSGAEVFTTITDNSVVDSNSTVTISASGNGYETATGQLIINDNEYANLTLTASKSTVTEGESFKLTVTTSITVKGNPLEVTLTSEHPQRFSFPQTVTIPVGKKTVSVDVTATDDDIPSQTLSTAFTASAAQHNKGEAIVLLQDNDLPVLTLELAPATVQESDGPLAVSAVLRRTTHTDSKITVRISDDANGALYYGNQTLELAKGVEEVHFNLGPVDNATVEGDRTYTITAAVWLSSCSCSAAGEAAGSVSAQLQVLDDDGPALSITSAKSTVKEGEKTTLTVTRNTTNVSQALTVALASDYDEGLSYNHAVTIAANKKSATVEVTANSNNQSDDNHTVIFTAQANGYATGTCYIMVTDQTLPDARISSFTSNVQEAEVGTEALLTIVVNNEGASVLPAGVAVKVYRQGESKAVATLYTLEALAVGASQTLTRYIILPTEVGLHQFYAVVNESGEVRELSHTNNTSQVVAINTIAPYSVTVTTNKTTYKQGEKVVITGQLTGSGTAGTAVDLYLINEGARQVFSVTTDEQGAFQYEYTPYALQSGHFIAGACYPNEGLTTEMAAFDVYGLRRVNNDFITCDTKLGEEYVGTIMIENPGQRQQTINSFVVVSKPDGCNVVLEKPNTIAANGTAQLKYKLTGTAVTETKDWEIIQLKVTTSQGSSLPITLYYYCSAQHAVLTANTNSIKTTMTKGATREYLLNVMNTGKAPSGKVTVQLPNVSWMQLGSPAEMSSLECGETATVCLRLTPTADMPLNVPNTGHIAINCENGDGLSVSYQIETVSEATGILTIDVVDEYTYYTEEKPHVAGAGIVVKHPVTGAIVTQGTTGNDGLFSVELPEGFYNISVTESHHNSVTGNILVDPGTTNYQEVFLPYNAITYSWDVVETEVEDEYTIETVVNYETNVPKPVVIVNIPTERPDDNSIIAIVVTNKGLINAQHMTMNLDCSEGYEFVLLNPEELEVLPPQQSHVFYARFQKKTTQNGKLNAWGDPDTDCISIFAGAWYDYICGNATNFDQALAQNGWGACMGSGGPGSSPNWRIDPVPHTGPSWPGGPSGPGGWKKPGENKPTPDDDSPGIIETIVQKYCDMPCSKELTQALACEAAGALIPDWISCPYDVINNCGFGSISDCASGILGCTPAGGHYNCWRPYVECMYNHYHSNHNNAPRKAGVMNTQEAIAANLIAADDLLSKQSMAFWRIIEEHFGEKEWLDCDNQSLADVLSVVNILGTDHLFTVNDFQNVKPVTISDQQLARFIERVNNTYQYANTGYEGLTNYINPDTLTHYSNVISQCEQEAVDAGYEGVAEMYTEAYNDLREYVSGEHNSVCASVSVKFTQTMVMTRQAFRGTMTVFNGNEETAMQDVKLSLTVTNTATGEVATSHEFQINAESLDGFDGALALDAGWSLAANATGTATVLFIPTKYAAPTEPVDYAFGGTLSYIDPFTGLEVTRELYPVTLTVKPSPELDLTYFMQRDVYGDDPLTLDVVEAMKPAEFALLINNKGNGEATNVRMMTQQPEIIENAKGLAIDFEILSSQVNGGDAALAFGKSIANDFGNIPAHSQMYAQWWLQSSLLGHFTDYDIEATHVTSYGNEDLSLLDKVSIHELIHGFNLTVGGKNLRAFLVNDIPDANDRPDKLYFSDGDTIGVDIAASASIERISPTSCRLTVIPSKAGWNYGSVLDPTYGLAELKSIVRQSDGAELSAENFWQTDRTLRDSKDWLYENRLHFIDNLASGTAETYLLTFEPLPDVLLAVERFNGIPEEGTVAVEPVNSVEVRFSKPIAPETFTADDITMNVQGVKQDSQLIGITTTDNQTFTLDLETVTESCPNGYYTLTVQTAGITDFEGFQGRNGKQAAWVLFRGGLVQLLTSAYPSNAGTVSATTSNPAKGSRKSPYYGDNTTAEYGSTVTLTATAATGYELVNWTMNGEVVSTEPQCEVQALNDMDIVANFQKKTFLVEVNVEGSGTVEPGATGIYAYGEKLMLTASPAEGYKFSQWNKNGTKYSTNATIEWTVKDAVVLMAVFTELPYATVSGLVRTSDTKRPLKDATVTLTANGKAYTTTSDATGHYSLQVEDRTLIYDVLCQANGFMDGPDSNLWFESNTATLDFDLIRGATVRMPANGVCTFSSPERLDFTSVSADVIAYYAENFTSERVMLHEIEYSAEGEGLILAGTPSMRIDVSKAESEVNPIAENLLVGTAYAPYTVGNESVYVLEDKNGTADFRKAAKGFVVNQYEAYLRMVMSTSSETINIIWGIPTLIDAVRAAADEYGWYNLDGKKIGHQKKGINVTKRKKIAVK